MTDQRTQAKIVSLLAQGFSRSTEIRSNRDLSFVVSRLEGEARAWSRAWPSCLRMVSCDAR